MGSCVGASCGEDGCHGSGRDSAAAYPSPTSRMDHVALQVMARRRAKARRSCVESAFDSLANNILWLMTCIPKVAGLVEPTGRIAGHEVGTGNGGENEGPPLVTVADAVVIISICTCLVVLLGAGVFTVAMTSGRAGSGDGRGRGKKRGSRVHRRLRRRSSGGARLVEPRLSFCCNAAAVTVVSVLFSIIWGYSHLGDIGTGNYNDVIGRSSDQRNQDGAGTCSDCKQLPGQMHWDRNSLHLHGESGLQNRQVWSRSVGSRKLDRWHGEGDGCWADGFLADGHYGRRGANPDMQMYLPFDAVCMDRGCRGWIRWTG